MYNSGKGIYNAYMPLQCYIHIAAHAIIAGHIMLHLMDSLPVAALMTLLVKFPGSLEASVVDDESASQEWGAMAMVLSFPLKTTNCDLNMISP